MLQLCKKICNECPFKKGSLQGWLGGVMDVEEVHENMKLEFPFACHKQLGEDKHTNEIKMFLGQIQVCRGYIASATKGAKMFGGSGTQLSFHLRELQKEITVEDKELVMPIWEFKKYHNG